MLDRSDGCGMTRQPAAFHNSFSKPPVLAPLLRPMRLKIDPSSCLGSRALCVFPSDPASFLAKLPCIKKPVKDFLTEIATQLLIFLKRKKRGKSVFYGVKFIRSHGVSKRFPLCFPNTRVRVKRNHNRLNWTQMRSMRLHKRIA